MGTFGRGWTNDRFVAHLIAPRRRRSSATQRHGRPARTEPSGPRRSWPSSRPTAISTLIAESSGERSSSRRRRATVAAALRCRRRGASRRGAGRPRAAARRAPGRPRGAAGGTPPAARPCTRKRTEFLVAEGVVAMLEPGRGDGGTVFVQGGGSRDPKDPPTVPQIVLAVEHYNRLARILERKVPVTLELDVENTFHDADLNAFNVVAEIPGTDKADELVMLGAHFDSWHAGTGATDNAAGSAVMMEAMRILKATGLSLRRTVRIGLWTGEEQGLLGSRAYVDSHFADPADDGAEAGAREALRLLQHRQRHGRDPRRLPAGQRGGRAGLPGMDGAVPQPRDDDGDDPEHGRHRSPVVRRGRPARLPVHPGSGRVQSRTHHSNMDVYDRLQAADMMQNAVIVAAFAYHAANRDALVAAEAASKAAEEARGVGELRSVPHSESGRSRSHLRNPWTSQPRTSPSAAFSVAIST